MNHEVRSIIKRSGITGLAKAISSDGEARSLTESEFVDLVTSYKLTENSNRSGAHAFADAYTAPTPDGEALRKAHAVVRNAQFAEPEYDDSAEAKWPSLKPYQQLSRALETEIALAKRAKRPSPTTSYAWPR